MANRDIVQPPSWKAPSGYSNAVRTEGGRMLFLGGQVAFDAAGAVVGKGDLAAQFRQVLENIREVVKTAGGSLDQVVKLTIFVGDKDEYQSRGKELGRIWREFFGRHFPAMTLVEISRFYEPEVMIEIDGIAVLD